MGSKSKRGVLGMIYFLESVCRTLPVHFSILTAPTRKPTVFSTGKLEGRSQIPVEAQLSDDPGGLLFQKTWSLVEQNIFLGV